MVFDKTGTLTTGDFSIKEMKLSGISREDAASIIVGIESHSNHPIALSLVKNLSEDAKSKIILTKVHEEKGLGLKAIDSDGNEYQLGSRKILTEDSFSEQKEQYDVYLKRNNEVVGQIALEDTLKPEAKHLIDTLKEMKITPILLSGDRQENCENVAQKLGIEEVYFEQFPQQKLDIIDSLKKKGTTAMVGDGINDAPALTTANVGVSLGNASQIAIQSAEVVLLNSDLSSVITLLKIGKHTLITIKQNLFWAFFYNIFAIPLAAMGYLGPMLAALAMASSDVIVIGNSLRLKIKKLS
jgi:Cu+-exporting ATPase